MGWTKGQKKKTHTSNIERDWVFLIFGTTKPEGVAMAIPILWEPVQQS